MTVLPASELFTPATAEEHFDQMRANATTLGLTTTAWQQGGVARTILAVFANTLMLADVANSIINQSGFLDYAATGTVTYTDPETSETITVQVTPDPSKPGENPTGALGALDVLADAVYDVRRILKTFAGGDLAILNTSASTYGPFSTGGYHVAQPGAVGQPSYSNAASLSIIPSPTVGTVTAATNASPIAITTAAPHGLATGAVVFILGVGGNTAANGAWIVTVTGGSSFTLDGSLANGAYTSGGTVYTPTVAAFTADSAGSASNATNPNVVTQAVTALVGVSVRNVAPWLGSDTESNVALAARCRLKLQSLSPNGPKGAYKFFALSSQQLAPTLTPPQSVASAITRALVVTDNLTGTVTTTIANAAGVPSAGDVTATDAVIQAFCVPQGITAITQAAAGQNVTADVTVYVPSSFATVVVPVTQVAVQVYFQLLDIGGEPLAGGPGPTTNVVSFDSIIAAIGAACAASKIPLKDVDLTLDGAALNVQLMLTPIPEVAVLSPATPTVNVVTV